MYQTSQSGQASGSPPHPAPVVQQAITSLSPSMCKTLYIVRHCKAAGQQPDAALTAEGHLQAEQLAKQLAAGPIDRIISSPFARATQSIAPLADRLGLPIATDKRLAERVLVAGDLSEWLAALKSSFDDLDRCFPGGESCRAAMERALQVGPTASPSGSSWRGKRRDGYPLGARVMRARQQPKGVPHVTIASTYDRRHDARRTVPNHAGHLHQGSARSGRPLSPLPGRAKRRGGPRLPACHA